MADETKEIYDHNGTKLDRGTYLANMKHNARKFAQFKGWDESRTNEFFNALRNYMTAVEEGRLSTDFTGEIIDTAGILDKGTSNWRNREGKVLSQEEYDKLKPKEQKKYEQNFYANTFVNEYMNALGDELRDQMQKLEKEKANKPATKFDFNTHGILPRFQRHLAPNGEGDLERWWNNDPYDETSKKRGTAKRGEILANWLPKYLEQLDLELDFSDTEWKTREGYAEAVNAFKDELLRNGVEDVDLRMFNALGANPTDYNRLFTTEQSYSDPKAPTAPAPGSPAGPSAEELSSWKNNKHNELLASYNRRGYQAYQRTPPRGISYDTKAEDKQRAYMNAINKEKGSDFWSSARVKSSDGNEYADYLEQFATIFPEYFTSVSDASPTYRGWSYMPDSFNYDDGSVLAFNPSTHATQRLYLGNLDSSAWDNYGQLLQQLYNESNPSARTFQQGGGLPITTVPAYSVMDMYNGSRLDALVGEFKLQSEATTNDPKTRKVGQVTDNDYNYSTGSAFTSADYARLSSIALDIAALVDPEPFSALGMGLASDISNLYADINEGYGFWETAGNFGLNVGLSAIGMIPIFGDAVGSGGKIVKSLVKMTPKISKYLMASGILMTVADGPDIMASLNKIGKDGPENEMTVQDWRNIANGLQLILGGSNAIKNTKTVKNLNARGKRTDMVDVLVTDKATGKQKTLRFGDKKDVEALKKAKTIDEANAVINGHKSLKDKYEVATKKGEEVSWFGSDSKWYNPTTWRKKTTTTELHPKAINKDGVVDIAQIRASAKQGKSPIGWKNRADWIAGGRGAQTPGFNPKNNLTPEGKPDVRKPRQRRQQQNQQQQQNQGQNNQPQQQPNNQNGHNNQNPGNQTPPPNLLSPADVQQLTYAAEAEFTLMQKQGKMKDLATAQQHPHSTAAQALQKDKGYTDQEIFDLGMWKQGGAIRAARSIIKARLGVPRGIRFTPIDDFLTDPFDIGVSGDTTPTIVAAPVATPKNTDTPKPFIRDYGVGYKGNESDYYTGREYGTGGTKNRINLSAIEKADASKRSPSLRPDHGGDTYDYTDAQTNTDIARSMWQNADGSRERDFANWTINWVLNAANNSATKGDYIGAYNTLIDGQYAFKRDAAANHTGDKSYWTDDRVGEFNRTNAALYASANSDGGVHGYDKASERTNGTTTAQRFIDITSKDIDLNQDTLKAELDKALADGRVNKAQYDRALLYMQGVTKDTTGRYYLHKPTDPPLDPVAPGSNITVNPEIQPLPDNPPVTPKEDTPAPAPGGETPPPGDTRTPGPSGDNPPEGDKPDQGGGNKTPFWLKAQGILEKMAPNAIEAARYIASKAHNKEQLDIAKRMPVRLYNPKEDWLWQKRDLRSEQEGQRQKGQLEHIADQVVGPSMEAYIGAKLTAHGQGVDYQNRKMAISDNVEDQSQQARWQQNVANHENRHSTAEKNGDNIHQKQVSDLTAEAVTKRADYESADALRQYAKTKIEESNKKKEALAETYNKISLANDVTADMAGYGIHATAEEQQMMNDIMRGRKQVSDLTPEQKLRYDILSADIDDVVTQRLARAQGLDYRPFTERTTGASNSGVFNWDIIGLRRGGFLPDEPDAVKIQRLRNKVQKMKLQQQNLKMRINAFEKDLDRAERSSSNYIKGQRKK